MRMGLTLSQILSQTKKKNSLNLDPMINIFKRALTIACGIQLFLSFEAESCTRIFWNDKPQAKIVARTMDLFISDESQIWINPRGLYRESKVDANGLKWTSIYGSVSISAFHVKDLITDGLNEHGLAVHALALGSTQYEKRNDRPGIHYGEWLQYLLDTCQTVEEALYAHHHFQVVPIAVNDYVWPLHLMMEDAKGDSAIVEFVDGQMKVYHSPQYRIGTTGPSYDEHLKNLLNYEEFGGTEPLPDKTDSISRFIRASAYLKQLPEPTNTDEAITLIRHTISRLFQKDNVSKNIGINFMGCELRVSTLWTAIADLTHRSYYFFPTGTSCGIRIDLSELELSESAPIEFIHILDSLANTEGCD